MNWQQLKTEIALPAYNGKTDAEIATMLNAKTVSVSRGIINSHEIIEATAPAEWASLSAAEKQRYQTITGAGQVDTTNQNVKDAFLAMFAGGTATRTALIALASRSITFAESIGIPGVTIDAGIIATARAS